MIRTLGDQAMTPEQRTVLNKCSDLGKVATPTDRTQVPSHFAMGLKQCLDDGFLVLIDSCVVPHLYQYGKLAIYQITESGTVALQEALRCRGAGACGCDERDK